MRLHVARLKDHRNKGFVSGFKWVPTSDQIADPLTRAKINPANLRRMMKTGTFKRPE